MTEERTTHLIKLVVMLVAIILIALVSIALVQTFSIKALQSDLESLRLQNEQTAKELQKSELEISLRENEETKDYYINEFLEKEGYVNDGEYIIKSAE